MYTLGCGHTYPVQFLQERIKLGNIHCIGCGAVMPTIAIKYATMTVHVVQEQYVTTGDKGDSDKETGSK